VPPTVVNATSSSRENKKKKNNRILKWKHPKKGMHIPANATKRSNRMIDTSGLSNLIHQDLLKGLQNNQPAAPVGDQQKPFNPALDALAADASPKATEALNAMKADQPQTNPQPNPQLNQQQNQQVTGMNPIAAAASGGQPSADPSGDQEMITVSLPKAAIKQMLAGQLGQQGVGQDNPSALQALKANLHQTPGQQTLLPDGNSPQLTGSALGQSLNTQKVAGNDQNIASSHQQLVNLNPLQAGAGMNNEIPSVEKIDHYLQGLIKATSSEKENTEQGDENGRSNPRGEKSKVEGCKRSAENECIVVKDSNKIDAFKSDEETNPDNSELSVSPFALIQKLLDIETPVTTGIANRTRLFLNTTETKNTTTQANAPELLMNRTMALNTSSADSDLIGKNITKEDTKSFTPNLTAKVPCKRSEIKKSIKIDGEEDKVECIPTKIKKTVTMSKEKLIKKLKEATTKHARKRGRKKRSIKASDELKKTQADGESKSKSYKEHSKSKKNQVLIVAKNANGAKRSNRMIDTSGLSNLIHQDLLKGLQNNQPAAPVGDQQKPFNPALDSLAADASPKATEALNAMKADQPQPNSQQNQQVSGMNPIAAAANGGQSSTDPSGDQEMITVSLPKAAIKQMLTGQLGQQGGGQTNPSALQALNNGQQAPSNPVQQQPSTNSLQQIGNPLEHATNALKRSKRQQSKPGISKPAASC
jgi:hypothetical protein